MAGSIAGALHGAIGFRYTIPFAEGARRVIAWQGAYGGFEESDGHLFYGAILGAWERLGAGMILELAGID